MIQGLENRRTATDQGSRNWREKESYRLKVKVKVKGKKWLDNDNYEDNRT